MVVNASHLTTGMAESLDYNFICHHSNADCIISIPSSRWDPDPDHSRRLHRHFGNLLTTIDDFDSEYFRCQRAEAELMDPQQRLLLHRCTLPAIDIRSHDTKCGVFVAISHIDYAIELCSLRRPLSPYMATGSANSVASGRVSYTFGLTGPCASVDTACSSALVGCHFLNGCILHENLNYGIAAAMNLCISQERYMIFYVAGMLSKEGRCKTLDAAADGYVRMESCCAVALVRSQHREHCKQAFCASVSLPSSVLNQDGFSSSLTAPNGPSQQALICRAMHISKADPNQITTLQMHGTGTPLGDPIEVGAICDAFAMIDCDIFGFALHSIKSILGHAETSAGALGLLQATQSLLNARSFPLTHLRSLNTHVSLSLQRFYKITKGGDIISPSQDSQLATLCRLGCKTTELNFPSHQMAGVSSFAFQGTNAHLVVASTSSEQTAHDHLKEKSACLLWRNEKILIKPHLHAFIQCAVQHLGNNSEFEFCIGFSSPGSSWLMDHRVGQYVIFPCTASLETADAAVNFGRCNRFSSCSTYCSFSLATLANTTLPFPIVLGKSADESSIIFVHVDNNSGQIIMQDRKPMIFFKACASEAILEHKSASKKVQAIHSITCRGLHMFDLTSLKDHSNFPQKSVKPSTFDGQVGAHKNDQIESQMKIIHRRAGFGQIVIRRDYVADGTWTHPAGTDCSLQVAFCISSKKIENNYSCQCSRIHGTRKI